MAKEHKHHIIPRSCGGTDEKSNIAFLTPYDHALHHALDFLEGGPLFDFRHEAWPLLPEEIKLQVRKERGKRLKLNHPMDYPGAREKVSLGNSGENNHMYGLLGQNNPNFGSKRTLEQREKISRSKKGKPNIKLRERLKLKPRKLSLEAKEQAVKNFEEYRHSGMHACNMKGRSWWVNFKGETCFQINPPGPEWQPGRKWRNNGK